MSSYNNRSSNDLKAVIQIIVSCVIIFISIAAIYVVAMKVSEIKILEKINLKEEAHDSITITTDTNAGTSLFVTDDKGLRFRKEDKTFAREEWIDKNGELFYFDTSGYGLNGELKKEGQVYTFENGKLKDIRRDTSYVTRANEELYSSIESAQYLVWLIAEEKEKTFYPIKYKQYSDDAEDYLGTEQDKQYASPNMMKIYMSDIYYLAVGKGTNYAGRLYRMRPGAVHKEFVGVGVTGYIVLSDEVVYYCDGQRVIKAKNWKSEDVNAIDLEATELNEVLNSVPNIISSVSNANVDTKKIDIFDLPIPDKKADKEIEEETKSNAKNETEKVEVGVTPILETEKMNNKSDGEKNDSKAPVPVEVAAPGAVEIGVAPH